MHTYGTVAWLVWHPWSSYLRLWSTSLTYQRWLRGSGEMACQDVCLNRNSSLSRSLIHSLMRACLIVPRHLVFVQFLEVMLVPAFLGSQALEHQVYLAVNRSSGQVAVQVAAAFFLLYGC